MKKIFSRLTIVLLLGCWTCFSLASGGSHVGKCDHEWKAAFNKKEMVIDQDAESAKVIEEGATISNETYLPGALQNFLLQ